jgi:hypothetical protein
MLTISPQETNPRDLSQVIGYLDVVKPFHEFWINDRTYVKVAKVGYHTLDFFFTVNQAQQY